MTKADTRTTGRRNQEQRANKRSLRNAAIPRCAALGYPSPMRRRAFLIAVFALAGCATAPVSGPAPIVAPAGTPLAELEPLYRAEAGRDGLTISVGSNGCTAKADFAFYVERKGEAVTLAFGRRRVDPCRSFAMGRTDLSFTWDELGVARGAPVFLLNPLVAWTGPGG